MQDLQRYRLSGLTTLLLWLGLSMGSLQGQILISEWMASNGDSLVDEDGESSDWVEIWNRGNQSISLEGFSLSVNLEDPRQWVFPAITLSSGQRMFVWASGKDRVDPTLPLHTNFRFH